MSRFFIDRPVFAAVLSIVIVLAGLAAALNLPVDQYPEIVPPEIQIRASYPGASAEVLSDAVAAPLEEAINGVDNMLYMHSSNSDAGTLRLFITFATGTDPDQALINVNNRVQQALARLPQPVRDQGVLVIKGSGSSLMMIALTAAQGDLDPIKISNYALLNIIDPLKRLPGVGDASLFGGQNYAMRIWLQPDRLAQYQLTPADVARAIREQNEQFAAGNFGAEPSNPDQAFTYTVTTRGRFSKPEDFRNIILRSGSDGSSLRLGDVARVELGAQDYAFAATYNGRATVPIGIYQQPDANALDTANEVRAAMSQIAKQFPAGLEYHIPFDTTRFVYAAIDEVTLTFIEALLLVVVVIYLFLQNPSATLIPVIAIPVSIIGAFAGLYLFGLSINMLTLFGMVLAIGIVVDDAIIVIENVERLMRDENLSPREASIKAMQQVTGPVIAVVLVLAAVFVPVGFLSGLAGEMYRQFAITIAVSVAISGLVALTLTPALCALLLRPGHHDPARPFRWFNRQFARLVDGYAATAGFLLSHRLLGIGLFLGLSAAALALFLRLPASLVPNEDQGYVLAAPQLPPAATLRRTEATSASLAKHLLAMDEIDHVVSFAGFDFIAGGLKTSAGAAYITLSPWAERKRPEQEATAIVRRIIGLADSLPEARLLAFNPPPIRGISATGGFEAYLQNRAGGNTRDISAMANSLVQAASQRPELARVRTTLEMGIPRYRAELDREKARALGVPIDDVFTALESTFGALYVNDFTLHGRNYQVRLQSAAEFRDRPEELQRVFVRSTQGSMVPLGSLLDVKRIPGTDILDRFNVLPSAKIMGDPAPGYSSGQALNALEETAAAVLDADHQLAWSGAAYQERVSGRAGQIAFGFGLVMVFLVLAAQYERWSLPFAIITAVPFAALGAALAVWLRGISNDLYFQVGLLVLIGLAAKNAILIVEFAVLQHKAGQSIKEAALAAVRLRLRPIIMTSLAFILGTVPLAISSGAGAASRHSIGTGVIGGMLCATFLAPLFIPLAYQLIEQASERLRMFRQPSRTTVADT